ncbi:hypothetical protein [Thioalkalivibrio sp. ALE16]|uniref:hypothetical protein n=1 Tax=Thioalkalivibrio sp. ALE16 TaxID=1158172 RepID=UPI00037F3069|nr:hypothetical protein [Thioalkalivibrio sp. ALE16]
MDTKVHTITFDADGRTLSVSSEPDTISTTPDDRDLVELIKAMGKGESHSIQDDPQGVMYAICDGATLAAIFDSLGDNWTEERLQEITEEMAAGLLEAGYKAA